MIKNAWGTQVNVYETVNVTLEDFRNKLNRKEYEVIAVEMNDLFVNNFELPNYELNRDSKYFIFNTEFGMDSTGGYSNGLSSETVDTLYVIV